MHALPSAGAILRSHEGATVALMGLTARTLVEPEQAAGRFSIVEHTLAPRSLGAPLHSHANEDEFTIVVEGTIGLQIGTQDVVAGPGDVVFKSRGICHAFWNAGDAPARMVEIISPGGFEAYFAAMSPVLGASPPDFEQAAALCARFGLTMQFESVGDLVAKHGLVG